MYIPEHFGIQELVPKDLHAKYKSRGFAFMFQVLFDNRLLELIDRIRNQFGPMTANDWSWGGTNQYRGFRPPECSIGAKLSQHRFGRAVDLIPKDCTSSQIRKEIIANQNSSDWKDIGGLEMDISWLHVDVRSRTDSNKINLFYP